MPNFSRQFRPLIAATSVVAALLAGCSSAPKTPDPKPLESSTAPLEQFLADAARARQEGNRSTERDIYRQAAKVYPTSKEPWVKLAETYFEATDYGNAILAAQEVLQRDAADKVATSLLAVSGLRVSTAALQSLRQQKDLNADTRSQAEQVVKSLREVLGEPVLVPKPPEPVAAAPASTPAPPKRVPPKPKPAVPSTPPSPAATAAAPPAPAPATPAPAPVAQKKPANPFDTLK